MPTLHKHTRYDQSAIRPFHKRRRRARLAIAGTSHAFSQFNSGSELLHAAFLFRDVRWRARDTDDVGIDLTN